MAIAVTIPNFINIGCRNPRGAAEFRRDLTFQSFFSGWRKFARTPGYCPACPPPRSRELPWYRNMVSFRRKLSVSFVSQLLIEISKLPVGTAAFDRFDDRFHCRLDLPLGLQGSGQPDVVRRLRGG